MGGNRFTSLATAGIDRLSQLKTLSLDFNQLTTLEGVLGPSQRALENLFLQGNHLVNVLLNGTGDNTLRTLSLRAQTSPPLCTAFGPCRQPVVRVLSPLPTVTNFFAVSNAEVANLRMLSTSVQLTNLTVLSLKLMTPTALQWPEVDSSALTVLDVSNAGISQSAVHSFFSSPDLRQAAIAGPNSLCNPSQPDANLTCPSALGQLRIERTRCKTIRLVNCSMVSSLMIRSNSVLTNIILESLNL